MTEQMTLRGTLKGHNGWVTQIATTPQFPDMILSASRGKRPLARNGNMAPPSLNASVNELAVIQNGNDKLVAM